MDKLYNRLVASLRDPLSDTLETIFRQLSMLDSLNLSQFVRLLPGVNSTAIKSDLSRLGYLRLDATGRYRVRAAHRELFLELSRDHSHVEIYPTFEGREALHRLHQDGALTLKKDSQ